MRTSGSAGRWRILAALLASIVAALSVTPSRASAETVVRTWDGEGAPNDVTWSNPVNWVGDIAPGPGDAIVFPPAAALRSSSNNLSAVFSSLTMAPGVTIFGPVRVAGPVTTGAYVPPGFSSSFIETLALEADLTITARSDLTIQALRLGGRAVRLAGNSAIGAAMRVGATPGSVEVAMENPGTVTLSANPADQDPGTTAAAAAVPARLVSGTASIGSWGGDIVMDGGALTTTGALTGRLTVNAGDVTPIAGALGDVVLTRGARWLLFNEGVAVRTITLGGATFVPAGFQSNRAEDPRVIVSVLGAAPPAGTFNGLADRGRFVNNVGVPFEIGYRGGDGNDITLTRVGAPVHRSGYWMVDAGGTVYPFGNAGPPSFKAPLTARAVGITHSPDYNGVWTVAENGQVHGSSFQAPVYSAPPALQAGERVTSLSYPRTRFGYWLFTSKGRVFAYGEANHLGDLGGVSLSGPVLGSIGSPTETATTWSVSYTHLTLPTKRIV